MNENLFIVAIGGTGMRCLESFVHLCAIGMFDGREINVLTLDTDTGNGNKGRVERLIETYNQIKTIRATEPGGKPEADTFFSAKINLFKFATDYSDQNHNNTYNAIIGADSSDDNAILADLFYDEKVQNFALDKGYRAQTHLGSMLMYHAIIDAVTKFNTAADLHTEGRDINEFLTKLSNATTSNRVFVFGSVFGGTGASSIPIIPRAFRDACANVLHSPIDPEKTVYASTLLTNYFSFQDPDAAQKNTQGVIAQSKYFSLNSQAALNFYNQDATVKKDYKRFYNIGWQDGGVKFGQAAGETEIGGPEQKNPCHVVELLAAAAAYDFFTAEPAQLTNDTVKNLFRSVAGFALTGHDFFDGEAADVFERKLGAMLSMAHLVLSKMRGAWEPKMGTALTLRLLQENTKIKVKDIDDTKSGQLDTYLKAFAYELLNDKPVHGWLYQLKSSFNGTLIFNDLAFVETRKQLEETQIGCYFIEDKYNWYAKKFLGASSYDKLNSKMKDLTENKDVSLSGLGEVLSLYYKALDALQLKK